MKHKIKVLHATNGTQALAALAEQNPILVIQDIDLGIGSENGIAVVKRLREAQFKGQICVHSNRFLQEDNRLALEAGAQYILPKPMTRSHLLQLLVVSLNGQQSLKLTTSAELAISQKSRPVSLQQVAMHIVVLDDSAAIRISWKTRFKDGKLTVFSSPEEFLAKIDAEPALLQSIDAIISDFHFDSKSKHDGFSFAAEFKKRSQLPLFLASDGEFIESEWLPLFKGILRKEVYSAAQISKLLNWERKL
jgi:DNA-binding response OmpR family regulator